MEKGEKKMEESYNETPKMRRDEQVGEGDTFGGKRGSIKSLVLFHVFKPTKEVQVGVIAPPRHPPLLCHWSFGTLIFTFPLILTNKYA